MASCCSTAADPRCLSRGRSPLASPRTRASDWACRGAPARRPRSRQRDRAETYAYFHPPSGLTICPSGAAARLSDYYNGECHRGNASIVPGVLRHVHMGTLGWRAIVVLVGASARESPRRWNHHECPSADTLGPAVQARRRVPQSPAISRSRRRSSSSRVVFPPIILASQTSRDA